MMYTTSKPDQNKALKTTQIVGVRIPVNQWNSFEIRCLENELTMSQVLRDAINNFLKDTGGNDKPILTMTGRVD
jgi:hypothetical protein